MKFVLAFTALVIGFSAQAATLKCEQNEGWGSVDMFVTASVKGEYEVISDKQAMFSEVDFDYKIFWDDSLSVDSIWSEGSQSYAELSNNVNYRPRKYKNHMQFSVWVDGSNAGSGYGDLDLILPTKEVMAATPSEFNAYMIMTWMDDHWGGTIQMKCSIR